MVDVGDKDVTRRVARAGGRIVMTTPTAAVAIEVTVETRDRTGVEMEALTAVAAGLLTIYDMCKAVDRGMRIGDIHLIEKQGGRSGHYRADDAHQRRGHT